MERLKSKMRLIWHILRAENFSAVVKGKHDAVVMIAADSDNMYAHLQLLSRAIRKVKATVKDEQSEENKD